jgi:hypothetical protein
VYCSHDSLKDPSDFIGTAINSGLTAVRISLN